MVAQRAGGEAARAASSKGRCPTVRFGSAFGTVVLCRPRIEHMGKAACSASSLITNSSEGENTSSGGKYLQAQKLSLSLIFPCLSWVGHSTRGGAG